MRHLIVAVLLWVPAAALGEQGWPNVERLRPGQTVTVHLINGGKLKGRVETAGPEALNLRTKDGSAVQTSRDRIARVTRKSRGRGAMWGGIIGFGIAAPIGAYAGPYITDWGNPKLGVRISHAAGWGIFFGGIGAGVGALAGIERTIYEPARQNSANGGQYFR